MTTTNPAWFSVWTKPKHEHIAAAGLRRNLGLEVFLPQLQFRKVTRNGWREVTEPLFPGYLFVRCQVAEKTNEIQSANGVKRLVQFGGKIPSIPDGIIEELQKYFETDNLVAVEESLLPGDEVSVAEGAFAGMSALVLRALPARQRVQILLEILGRPTTVEVGRHLLVVKRNGLADLVPFLAASPRPGTLPA